MAHEITTHHTPGLNEHWQLKATDEPGPGGANHRYLAHVPNSAYGLSLSVCFQTGPVKEAGVNGVTNELLLAIVRDRLEGFQRGPFACEANQDALDHVIAAMVALQTRTEERLARGVEGTNVL